LAVVVTSVSVSSPRSRRRLVAREIAPSAACRPCEDTTSEAEAKRERRSPLSHFGPAALRAENAPAIGGVALLPGT